MNSSDSAELKAAASAVIAVYVGKAAESNLALGLEGGVWGWKGPQPVLENLPPGSHVVFGVGYSGGSPRTPTDLWRENGLRRVVVARTTGPAYRDDSPFWPDENEDVSYPFRLPIKAVQEFSSVPLSGGPISLTLSDAIKRSVSGGNAVIVSGDGSAVLRGESVSEEPADLSAICRAFRLAAEGSGMALSGAGADRVDAFLAAVITKPFVILSGQSGSGKTQLAMRLGEWFGSLGGRARFLSVAVRPDWTGPDALFGYEDALRPTDGGRAAWFVPETLRFLLAAAQEPSMPYLLLLDEMNLAHVERYFSDFLSGIESRHPVVPNLLRDASGEWRTDREGPERLPIPRNIVVVGTVNVDETTYLFSPKVLDRATTFEIRTTADELVVGGARPREIAPGRPEHLRGLAWHAADDEWHLNQASTHQAELANRLKELHRGLSKTSDEFGHRVFYESLRLAAALRAQGADDLFRTLDFIVLLKILPRIHGARRRVQPVLELLRTFAQDPNSWVASSTGSAARDAEGAALPRTAAKLDRMLRAVEVNQFVSFTE